MNKEQRKVSVIQYKKNGGYTPKNSLYFYGSEIKYNDDYTEHYFDRTAVDLLFVLDGVRLKDGDLRWFDNEVYISPDNRTGNKIVGSSYSFVHLTKFALPRPSNAYLRAYAEAQGKGFEFGVIDGEHTFDVNVPFQNDNDERTWFITPTLYVTENCDNPKYHTSLSETEFERSPYNWEPRCAKDGTFTIRKI